MRNSQWLRYGLASLTIFGAGLSAFVVACGDDDTGPGSSTSSSSSSSTGGQGSSSSSSSSSSSGAPAVEPAKLQLINAATDFGPGPINAAGGLRICYKIKGGDGTVAWAPLPPLPNRPRPGSSAPPGLYIGTGGSVEGTGADFSGLEITPYLISAGKMQVAGLGSQVTAGNDKSCEELIDRDAGAGQIVLNQDYWILPPVPSGTLQQKKSYILLLTGCTGNTEIADNETAIKAKCGADWSAANPNGNLKISVFEVDRAAEVPATELGAQFIHASPNADLVIQGATSGGLTGVVPAITSDPTDAGNATVLSDGGTVPYLSVTPLKQVTGATPTSFVTPHPNLPATFAVSFPQIAALSTGVPDGGAYANGGKYTFVAVGDPTADRDGGPAAPGGFNLRYFHILGLPNDPAAATFDPNK